MRMAKNKGSHNVSQTLSNRPTSAAAAQRWRFCIFGKAASEVNLQGFNGHEIFFTHAGAGDDAISEQRANGCFRETGVGVGLLKVHRRFADRSCADHDIWNLIKA